MMRLLVSWLFLVSFSQAFSILPSKTVPYLPALGMADWAEGGSSSSESQLEQLEFKIYPDGRVEETVRGIKGNQCHKVTESINAMLGKVVSSQPTEELYEQPVRVSEQVTLSTFNSDGNSWESSSSSTW